MKINVNDNCQKVKFFEEVVLTVQHIKEIIKLITPKQHSWIDNIIFIM
jgi:hypothetical protein